MTERRKSGWLSSVVGNISGLWSRSPLQDGKSPHSSFTEVQADSDFEGADRFEDAVSQFSPDKPTTSSNGVSAKSRSARYLSPTLLMNSVKSSIKASTESSRPSSIRKRAIGEVTESERKFLSNGKFSNPNLSLDISFPSGSSSKRICSSSRFLNETAPQLDRSFLNRSADPSDPAFEFSTTASLLQPRVSRPPSATSSVLSSKTLAILQQLEKISTPAKEVKKLPFICRSERWSADACTPVSRTLSNSSGRGLSRAQVISNAMSASFPSKSFWRRPEQRVGLGTTSIMKKADFLSGRKTEAAGVSFGMINQNNVDSGNTSNKDSLTGLRRKHEPVMKALDGKATKRIPKVFSAKALDLEVDGHESDDDIRPPCESLFSAKNLTPNMEAPAPGFLGTIQTSSAAGKDDSSNVSTSGQDSECLGDELFSFSRPEKRGPSRREEQDRDSNTSSEDEEEDEVEGSEGEVTGGDMFETQNNVGNNGIEQASKFLEPKENCEKLVRMERTEQQKNDVPTFGKAQMSIEKKSSDAKLLTVSSSDSNTKGDPVGEKAAETSSFKKWTCLSCWVPNEKDAPKCICCGSPAPAVSANSSAVSNTSNLPASSVVSSTKSWSCPECFVSNKDDAYKCVCCGYEKKSLENDKNSISSKSTNDSASDGTLSLQSSSSIFGEKAFKPMSTSSTGASFGFGLKKTSEASTSDEISAKPSLPSGASTIFGVANTSVGSQPSDISPKFGLNASSSAPNFGLLFGKSQETPSSLSAIPEEKTTITATTTASLFGSSSATEVSNVAVKGDLEQTALGPTSKSIFSFQNSSSGPSAIPSTSETNTFTNLKSAPISVPSFPSVFSNVNNNVNKPLNGTSDAAHSVPSLGFGSNSIVFGSSTSENVAKTLPLPETSQVPKESTSSVEMASPTSTNGNRSSQTSSGSAFSFSTAPTSFNFLSSSTAPNLSSGGIFGSVGSSGVTAPTFAFGTTAVEPTKSLSQGPAVSTAPPLTKVFSAPSTVPIPPPNFNFGATSSTSSNPFGGTSQPPAFSFGAATENPFNVSAAPFGGSSAQPNFFNSGTTTTTARRMLKARRMRK